MAITTLGAPTTTRDLLPDALRGFALMGILVINAFPTSGYLARFELGAEVPVADQIIGLLTLTLAYGKFYVLFSFLFGLGFSYFLERADTDASAIRRFVRRLFILLIIGFVHLLFWSGDILFLYALAGFLLIPFRRASIPTLLKTALVLWSVPVVLDLAYLIVPQLDISPAIRNIEADLLASWGIPYDNYFQRYYAEPHWDTFFKFNAAGIFYRFADFWESARLFKVLAMFLLGLAAGRAKLHRDLGPVQKYLKPLALWGTVIGLPLNLPVALTELVAIEPHSPTYLLTALAYWIGVPLLSAAWISAFLLLWQRNKLGGFGRRLVAIGRMALTNYLTQTAIGLIFFLVLGFSETLYAPGILLYIVAVWVLQLIWSPIWLRHFAYGPFEYLWRWATYGKKPSMKPQHAP